jgi:hypothetical protein
MVTIDELRRQFKVDSIPPYGLVIVVPGDEFDPDWEAELDVDVIQTDFGDPAEPFTLIPLKKGEKPTGIPAIPKQPESSSKVPNKTRKRKEGTWTLKDEERLLKRWNEVEGAAMERAKQLAPEFNGRKPEAVYQKHWSLITGYLQKKKDQKMPRDIVEQKRKVSKSEQEVAEEPEVEPRLIRMDFAEALAALVEAVGPENVEFNISIQINTTPNKPS